MSPLARIFEFQCVHNLVLRTRRVKQVRGRGGSSVDNNKRGIREDRKCFSHQCWLPLRTLLLRVKEATTGGRRKQLLMKLNCGHTFVPLLYIRRYRGPESSVIKTDNYCSLCSSHWKSVLKYAPTEQNINWHEKGLDVVWSWRGPLCQNLV